MFIAICMMVSFLSQTSLAAEPRVSSRAVRAFETSFTEAEDARWSEVENLFKVTFTLEDRPMFAFYNAEGELVASGKHLTVKQLPKAAQKHLAGAIGDYTVTEIFVINEGLDSKYYVTLKNGSEVKVILSAGGKWSTFTKSSK